MANEVVVTTFLGNAGDPVEYTIADTAFAKGCIMQISATSTIAKAATDGQFFAGVLSAEKKSGDGEVKAAVLTHFVGEFTADTAGFTFGQPVKIDTGDNLVSDPDADGIAQAGEVVGLALETVTDGNRGSVLVNR